jgi:hypothetical protein
MPVTPSGMSGRTVEHADTADIGVVGHWQHDGEHTIGAQPEVASSVLPDRLVRSVVGEVRPFLRMATL